METQELANLIWESGFSTHQDLNDVAGRGVGMDAVKHFVEKLGGQVHIKLEAKLESTRYAQFIIAINLPISLLHANGLPEFAIAS